MSDKLVQSRAARWGLLVSLVAAFALMSGLCLPGCSENPADSSQTAVSDDVTSIFDLPYDEVEFAKRLDDPNNDVEIIIGEESFSVEDGGTMTIGTTGDYQEFTLLPTAISCDTVITVEVIKLSSKSSGDVSIVYDFQPDGLVFSVPAILRINVAKVIGKRATSVDFYYLDESFDAPVWVKQGTFFADESGYVEIPVYHFSKYGID